MKIHATLQRQKKERKPSNDEGDVDPQVNPEQTQDSVDLVDSPPNLRPAVSSYERQETLARKKKKNAKRDGSFEEKKPSDFAQLNSAVTSSPPFRVSPSPKHPTAPRINSKDKNGSSGLLDSSNPVLEMPRPESRDNQRIQSAATNGSRHFGISAIFRRGPQESTKSFYPTSNFFGSSKKQAGKFPHLGQRNTMQTLDTDVPSLELLESNDHLEPVNLDLKGLKVDGGSFPTALVLKIVAAFALVALVGAAIAIPIAAQSGDDSFCGSAEQDAAVRLQIAASFDASVQSGIDQAVSFTGQFINCLPSNAFSEVNAAQSEFLSGVTRLEFTGVGLARISPTAFASANLDNVLILKLSNNGIQNLDDNVLVPFSESLVSINLAQNAFSTLKGDVFKNAKKLQSVNLDGNSGIYEIPPAVAKQPEITTVSLIGCNSLVSATAGMFANSPNVANVHLPLSVRNFLPDDGEELAAFLGLNEGIIVTFT